MSNSWNKEDDEDMETLAKSISKKQKVPAKKNIKTL
jgi:hypothetical protein